MNEERFLEEFKRIYLEVGERMRFECVNKDRCYELIDGIRRKLSEIEKNYIALECMEDVQVKSSGYYVKLYCHVVFFDGCRYDVCFLIRIGFDGEMVLEMV